MKILLADVETTGLLEDPRTRLHQIAGKVLIDGNVVDSFDIKVCPPPYAMIDPEALAISGKTVAHINTYQSTYNGYKCFTDLLDKYIHKYERAKKDKFFFSGYNAGFDVQYVRRFFLDCGDQFFGSYFWTGTLDIMVYALGHLSSVRHTLPNFKLGTVASTLGVPLLHAHDAESDIEATLGIARKIAVPGFSP